MARGVPSMHPRKACRNQGREAAANAAVTRSRRRRDVLFIQPPARAIKLRVPTAQGRRPPQFVQSFSSSWSADRPGVAASMRPCEACRCRHGAGLAIRAPAQVVPPCRCRHGAGRAIHAPAQVVPPSPGDRDSRSRCHAVMCDQGRTVCPLIFKQLVGRQAPVSRLA